MGKKTEELNLKRTLVTPVEANEWLATSNTLKLPLNDNKIALLADTMVSDTELVLIDPVAFNSEGVLLSGQNILEAICMTGIPQKLFIFEDISEEKDDK